MKQAVSIILVIITIMSFCSCGKKEKSDAEYYAEQYELMDNSIVREIESDYVNYDKGTSYFSSEALRAANNRIRLRWNNYEKVAREFDYIVLSNGEIGSKNSDFGPYTYIAHGYIVGKDLYGEKLTLRCNITITKSKSSGYISFGGIHIEGLDDNL